MKFSIFEEEDDLLGNVVLGSRHWMFCGDGDAYYCEGTGMGPDGNPLPGTHCERYPSYDGYCGGGTYFLTIPQQCQPGQCHTTEPLLCCCNDEGGHGG